MPSRGQASDHSPDDRGDIGKKTNSLDDVDPPLAVLDGTGEYVLCHSCGARIADMIAPRKAAVTEWNGPVVGWVELEAGQRLAYLIHGMVLDEKAGLWRLSRHARQQQRHRLLPTYRRKGGRTAPYTYPARVRCPDAWCGQVQVLEKEALGIS